MSKVKQDKILAVSPETLLQPLPPMPDWFQRELNEVANIHGKPLFKIVDGQRELKWRNGKLDVKHLIQHENIPAYVPVIRQVFRRQDTITNKYKLYSSYKAAQDDSTQSLKPEIDYTSVVTTRGVGRACWIVEVYIAPEELGELNWEAGRFANLQVHGVYQKIDVLGPFPREGMYIYSFAVLDDNGNAISPNRRTIEECQKKWRMLLSAEPRVIEDDINLYEEREKKHTQKQIAEIADSVYQSNGLAARRLHGAVTSKPIIKVYE